MNRSNPICKCFSTYLHFTSIFVLIFFSAMHISLCAATRKNLYCKSPIQGPFRLFMFQTKRRVTRLLNLSRILLNTVQLSGKLCLRLLKSRFQFESNKARTAAFFLFPKWRRPAAAKPLQVRENIIVQTATSTQKRTR